SELGQGTTIDLWLPEAEQDPAADGIGTEANGDEGLSLGPLRVMLVDDDSLVRLGTAALLEDLGHAVLEAGSGLEALRRLRENPDIDLVITDQAMPLMSGTDLARALASEFPSIKVILATGITDSLGEAEDALALPTLTKPYTQQDVCRAIAAAGSWGRREPASPVPGG
ncbi:MAG: response regulator, partial [Acetobacteraceae bacterium]|nr:response regulator [Acetobacteraceae bacterium]